MHSVQFERLVPRLVSSLHFSRCTLQNKIKMYQNNEHRWTDIIASYALRRAVLGVVIVRTVHFRYLYLCSICHIFELLGEDKQVCEKEYCF